jgi:breast cancer 2 susceptibility protein
MERRFPSSLAQSYLTYDHVITQLQKRYDRELKGGERSALRKVLNRDVAANCMMILCVSQILGPFKGQVRDIQNSKHDQRTLELTDGWYSIRGVLDTSLGALVRKGKIKMGTKLLICNGKLEGSEDGVDPLDPSYSCSGQNCSVALCLSANGTRLASWDAKMGFVKPCRYIRSTRGSLLVRSISHIIPGGGNVPLIDLIVCRLYPRMFLERKGTSNPSEIFERHSGKSPVISEAQEYANRMDFEKKRQEAIERLFETVQNECAKVRQCPH